MRRRHEDIINRYRSQLFQLRNVVGVGFGKKEKNGVQTDDDAIIVLVKKKQPLEELSENDLVPQTIENFKTDIQEIGELKFQISRTDRLRPAQPGISIGHYKVSAGTFGAVVRDRKTGTPLILSNNHVLANQTNGYDGRAKVGDPILQPGKYDDGSESEDIIAFLERFIPVNTRIERASYPIAVKLKKKASSFRHSTKQDYSFKLFEDGVTNRVDCAVAKPIKEDYIDENILEIGKVKGIREPEIGLEVVKSGRTTGITKGKIKVIDSTVEVTMDDGLKATFEDQIIMEPLSEGGDSGSLVLDKNNKAIGLLFAGSSQATVCNKITFVLEALEVTFPEY